VNCGVKLSTMPGKSPNPASCSGIIIRESIPDCYADMGFKQYPPTMRRNSTVYLRQLRLLAINLYNYVDKPFTAEASFDSELFISHVHKAQRIMDDIIDLELEKIDRILLKLTRIPKGEIKPGNGTCG